MSLAWADAWLLYAVLAVSHEGPAPLEDVIAAGDAVNHAIITFDELALGLERLSEAGYVIVQDKRLAATERAREARRRSTNLQTLARRIGADAHQAPGRSAAGRFFTHDEYDAACARYRKEFWNAYREIQKRS